MDRQFVNPSNHLPQPLLQNSSTSIPNMSIFGSMFNRPSSVTPPPQLPEQQQNFTLNHNDTYSQSMDTSYQNCSYRNFCLLQTELYSLRQRNATLEEENFSLRGNPNTVPKEQYDEVLKGNSQIAANNDKLFLNNQQLLNENQIFSHNIEELKKELELKKEKCVNVEKQCEELTHNKKELDKQVQELEQSIEASKNNLKSVQEKTSSLEESHATALKELKDNVSKGKSEILKLKKEFNDAMNDLEGKRATLQDLYEQCKSQNEEEVGKLQESLKDLRKNVSLLAGDKSKLLDEVKCLKHEVFTLQKEKQAGTKNNEKVIQLNTHLKEVKVEVEKQKERIRKLEQDKANAKLEFDAERKRLKEKYDRDTNRYDQFFSENVTLRANKKVLTETLKLEKEKCKEIRSRCDEVTRSKEKLKKQFEAGNATVQKIEQKFIDSGNCHQIAVEELNENLRKRESQILSLELELKNSIGKANLITGENRTLQNQIASKGKENSNLKEELKTSKECIICLTDDERKLKKQVQSEVDCLQMQNEQPVVKNFQVVGSEKIQDKAEVQKQKESFKKLRSEISNATIEFEAELATLRIEALKTENKDKQANAAAEDLKTQVESLRSENESLSSQLECRFKEAQNLQAENKSLSSEYTKAIDELKLANEKLENQLELNANKIISLEEELKEQKQNLALQKQAINQLEKQVEENVNEMEMQESTINRKEGRVKLLLSQLMNRELDNLKLERKLDSAKSLEHKLNHSENENTQLNQVIHDLGKSLQEYKNQSMQHKESLKQIRDQNFDLKRKGAIRTNNTAEVDKLKVLMENHVQKIQKANGEINSLKSQVTSFEKCLEENKEIIAKQKKALENNEKYVAELRMELCKLQLENKQLESNNKTDKADSSPDCEESPAKKARKEPRRLTRHDQGADDDDDFFWRMIRNRETDN